MTSRFNNKECQKISTRVSLIVTILTLSFANKYHCLNNSIVNNYNNNSIGYIKQSDQSHLEYDKILKQISEHNLGSLAGFLLADDDNDNERNSNNKKQNLDLTNSLDLKLWQILQRNGPDMKPLSGFRDSDDITVEIAARAWQLMRRHAHWASSQRLALMRPALERLLLAANVSQACSLASMQTLEAAQRLDSWAIQLLTAWGSFPPTGLFEGTLGDIGSFHGCVNVPESRAIGHAHYCTISYRPVMPARKNYELIVNQEPPELLRLFDRRLEDRLPLGSKLDAGEAADDLDAFGDLIKTAQYNHYIYYKLGACFPIKCSPFDVKKLASLVGRRAFLMSGPVKCSSKYSKDYDDSYKLINGTETKLTISTKDLNEGIYIWKPHITQAQLVSLAILSILICSIIMATILDLFINRNKHLNGFLSIGDKLQGNQAHNINKGDQFNSNENLKQIEKLYELKQKQNFIKTSSIIEQNNNNNAIELFDTNNNDNNNFPMALSPNYQAEVDCFQTIPLDRNQDNVSLKSKREEGEEEEEQNIVEANSNLKFDRQLINKNQDKRLFVQLINDCSLITNTREFFKIGKSHLNNDISCLNGIRCITMSWIIMTHTMQYNDWSAFARTREIETHLKSLINQPLFNGSYLVDTFFLVSGLLAAFTVFKLRNGKTFKELLDKFSIRSYLIGRYLRLTPQILLTSLLFIVLPLLSKSGGPHWYTITGEYSENCSKNWWINLFYLQAFYESNEMCNFVCWWVSVDMLYHLFALALILLILYGLYKLALAYSVVLIIFNYCLLAKRHYELKLPPNLLSTIPQTGAMWSDMMLNFFWMPYAHAYPFFFGFYIGYLLAQKRDQLIHWFTPKKAIFGWLVTICLFVIQSYSTYFWIIGKIQYSQIESLLFYLICPIIWATNLAWIIIACQCGFGGLINTFLSCKLFVILGKASYIVYLSHFLVLFTFFGSQNLLLEPTQLMMLYVILGNICLSMLFGCLICITFEMPWLKIQKRIMRFI